MENTFNIKDCALIAIATGYKAQTLRELRSRIEEVPEGCIYYHFWGGLLRSKFDDPEFPNDFASWARHSLYDKILAERLAIINPIDFENLEGLRWELLEVIDERLDELDIPPWVEPDQQFYFVRSQIVVLDTGIQVKDCNDLREWIPDLSLGSIFYHFIDARRRPPYRRDDFSVWLETLDAGYGTLIQSIRNIDPFFTSLRQIRIELEEILGSHAEG
ncbi:MAG: DUF5752 family protein [Syntrophales bacterium]|nr:DUF5752 family protein [Syntrophales bacterium]MDY0044054.1 DUF5752 family protein [Syntrophales bacterium]